MLPEYPAATYSRRTGRTARKMSGEESARSSLETPGEDIHAGGSGSNPLPEHHIEHPFRDLPPAPPTGPTTGPTPGAGTVAQATFPPTVAAPNIITHGGEHGVSASGKRGNVVSGTWTLSSGDYADLSEADDADTRDEFVKEYNYLAKKVGGGYFPSFPPDISVVL